MLTWIVADIRPEVQTGLFHITAENIFDPDNNGKNLGCYLLICHFTTNIKPLQKHLKQKSVSRFYMWGMFLVFAFILYVSLVMDKGPLGCFSAINLKCTGVVSFLLFWTGIAGCRKLVNDCKMSTRWKTSSFFVCWTDFGFADNRFIKKRSQSHLHNNLNYHCWRFCTSLIFSMTENFSKTAMCSDSRRETVALTRKQYYQNSYQCAVSAAVRACVYKTVQSWPYTYFNFLFHPTASNHFWLWVTGIL